jgi:transcriptional regulator with XRE-family HTH domain
MKRRKLLLPIGEVLRQAREKAGMTQEELAFEAEIDRSYVSYLENDRKSPTIEMLSAICKVLGVAVSEIIKRAEKVHSKGR